MKLPSGSELQIQLAKFSDAHELYQAFLSELKGLKMDPEAEVDVNLVKDVFCAGLSSKAVDAALLKCFKVVTIDDLRLTDLSYFEPEEKRQDYMVVCIETAKANILPFVKSLSALYGQALELIKKDPA